MESIYYLCHSATRQNKLPFFRENLVDLLKKCSEAGDGQTEEGIKMEENTYLSQSQLNGIWKASYSNPERFSDHDADAEEEQATISFDQGLLSGDDPLGGKYIGIYSIKEGKLSAKVEASSPHPDAKSFFGFDFPYTLEFFGNYSDPDYFSINGLVIGMERQITVNCRRVKDIE